MLKAKEIVDSGRLGHVRSVVFQELLDRKHGSSYFRRWNRRMNVSGGLLVHKASHCFDLINWCVGARPRNAIAQASLTEYGPGASEFRGERCSTCPHADRCPQYVDVNQEGSRGKLYVKAQAPGSYTPDLCVFDPEIDIHDHACVAYDYENDAQVTFELCAYADYEGYTLAIQGTKARLETGNVTLRLPKPDAPGETEVQTQWTLRIVECGRPPEDIDFQVPQGGHGGADQQMVDDLFGQSPTSPVIATLEDGIQAVLVGAAANRSIAEGRRIDVQALIEE